MPDKQRNLRGAANPIFRDLGHRAMPVVSISGRFCCCRPQSPRI